MDLYTGWIRCEKQVNLEMLYRPLWFNPKVVSRVGAKNPFSSFYLHTLHALWLFNRTHTTGLMIHNVVFQHVALNKMQMLLKIIYFHLVFEETWCWAVQPVTRFRERLLCVCVKTEAGQLAVLAHQREFESLTVKYIARGPLGKVWRIVRLYEATRRPFVRFFFSSSHFHLSDGNWFSDLSPGNADWDSLSVSLHRCWPAWAAGGSTNANGGGGFGRPRTSGRRKKNWISSMGKIFL